MRIDKFLASTVKFETDIISERTPSGLEPAQGSVVHTNGKRKDINMLSPPSQGWWGFSVWFCINMFWCFEI